MRTGDGETEDTGALTHEENVIRLPRDWLGPPEELVPIGPAARARAAQRELDGGTPPTADAFWSEDSAALHDAVQAPAPSTRAHVGPPVGLVPPLAGQRLRTLNRLPWLRLGGARPSRWWGVAAVPIVALLVAAIIGTSESPASHPATGSWLDPARRRGGPPWQRGPRATPSGSRRPRKRAFACRSDGPSQRARDHEAARRGPSASRAHARGQRRPAARTYGRCAPLHGIAGTDRHRGGRGATLNPGQRTHPHPLEFRRLSHLDRLDRLDRICGWRDGF